MIKKIKQFITNQFERQTTYLAEYLSEQSVLNTDRVVNELKTLSNDIVKAMSNKGVENAVQANTSVLQGITKEISAFAENIREKELKMQIPTEWDGNPWSQLETMELILKEQQRLLEIISSQY